MRTKIAVFCLALSVAGLLIQGASQGASTTSQTPRFFLIGKQRIEVTADAGKLRFQTRDADGSPEGEPWFWPEEGSPLVFETPQIVESGGEIWLTFVERSPDGSTRSRTVSLSEIFANGFEAGTTAAWSDTQPAVNLFIESPAQNAAVGDDTPAIRVLFGTPTGIAIAPATLAFTRGGSPLAVSCSPIAGGAECVPTAPFADGAVTISATIADVASHVSPAAIRSFLVDTAAPVVNLSAPADDFLTGETSILVAGSVSEAATVTIGSTPVALGAGNSFSLDAPLAEGPNVLVATATDAAGNVGMASRSGVSDTLAPPPVAAALVTNVRSASTVAITGAPGAAEGEATVRWRNQRTAQVVEVAAAANGSFATSISGADGDVLIAIAIDALGHESLPAYFPVDYQVPADPTPFAPPLDPTVAYDLGDAIAFLYDGPNAIQKEVAPGAIEERRLAWLRGKVRQRGGAPLPGARVTVLGHPELGYTLSRADGVFDLVVNGGGTVTLSFERVGFLPAQRQEEMAWRDSTVIDDVILLGLDPVATEITSGSLVGQIARSTPQEDGDGEREAILFIPPGTTASMVMPGGSSTPLPTLTVRATEYTVGEEGFLAMPGPLPPSVAYTYAVELSADEAVAAHAERVEFNQPVYLYVDSFIPLPVGSPVPLGWYDAKSAMWMPADNGRVIEILAAGLDGLAGIDAEGGGTPADAPLLAELGFTDAERQQLAMIYEPGDRIWRVPIPHFTPWDLNFPWSPPEDAKEPPEPVYKTNDDDPDGDQHDDDGSDEDESDSRPVAETPKPDCVNGSIIECENQILRQEIAIVGTPYRLAYSSQRTPSWDAGHTAEVALTDGSALPASLEAIDSFVEGHGFAARTRLERPEFEAGGHLSWLAQGPLSDAFGRPVTGSRLFRFGLGYSYSMVYRTAPEFARSWARFPNSDAERISPPGPRQRVTLWRYSNGSYDRVFRTKIGAWDGRIQKMGGFSIDVHHSYDPAGRTLYRGDGSQRSAEAAAPTLRRIAGTGEAGFSGDGSPATLAELSGPADMVFGADGSLYFADLGNYRIRVVRPGGTIETVAGNGSRCILGGGGGSLSGEEEPPPTCDRDVPATSARLNGPAALDVGPDGSLYFGDFQQNCIYRVDPAGILRVAAGICRPVHSGPGSRPAPRKSSATFGPATEVELENPNSLAVTSTGILYIADNSGLSQVTPDGMLARFGEPNRPIFGLAAGDNGELYLLDDAGAIHRMESDGSRRLVAGGGFLPALDGEPAIGAYLGSAPRFAYGRDGRIYFMEDGIRVRRIEGDGTLRTVAGPPPTAEGAFGGDTEEGGFLLGNGFGQVGAIAADVAGNLLIADTTFNQIFQGQLSFPDYIEDELEIAEGGQVYVFDDRGRHLRTRHALTGATLYDFGYDSAGLLVSIEDGSGNLTTIERNGSGTATAIVSPFGQRTELEMDPQGWLESIENPVEETHHFSYLLGRMVEAEDPRGNVKRYSFSDRGRLTDVFDESDKHRELLLNRRYGTPDHTVTLAGANGQKTQYTVRTGPNGEVYRSVRNPDGLVSITRENRGGVTERQERGILSDLLTRPDPRLGEGSAYTARSWVFMSEELELETNTSIDTTLADPTDPWSFEDIATVTETNGRLTSSLYTAATRTLTTVSPAGRAVGLQLDELARPIRFEAPETEIWTASYFETGELEEISVGVGLAERKTTFGYDALHRLETIEDAESRIVTFAYDGANRVTSTILPDLNTVGFSYDGNGNVESVTPPGKPAHLFTYTPRNQLETYTLPDAGSGVAVEQRVYDDSKRLKEVHRPDGKLVTFEYQPQSDRLARIVSPRGNTDFDYDSTTGLVSEIEEPDGQKLSFEYEGLLLKRTTWTGEVNGSVGRTYDENFRVKTIDVNGQDPIEYVYDDDNLLVQVGDMTITRDPETGRELTTQLGNVTTERTYTSFGEPESYTAKFSGTEIYYERYTYNKLGWITDLERRQNGFNEDLHYEYDERGRLIEVWRSGVLESSYTYDANSNRLSYTGPLGNAAGTYDARDRMLTYGGASYTWSEAGELQSKTEGGYTTTYDYDVFGNLRKVALPNGIEIEYLTDGAQRRVGKKIDGVLVKQWLYQDQLEPIAEMDWSGNIIARYIYRASHYNPDAIRTSAATYRYISDKTGSVRLLVDVTSGSIAQEVRRDEFGRILLQSSSNYDTFGFSGGLYDSGTDMIRFGSRDYDPLSGRWTDADPIGFAGGSSNQYEYVSTRPNQNIDPTGLEDWFGGVEADGVVIGGGEVSLGVVLDTDDVLASGIYLNGGNAAGANVGWGAGVGCYFRDAEGWGLGLDLNLPFGASGQLFYDDQGWNGWGISVGPGGGLSVSSTYTGTLSPKTIDGIAGDSFRRTVGGYLDQLNQAIERELLRLSR